MIHSRAKSVHPSVLRRFGPPRGRPLIVLSAVSTVLCLNLLSFTPAGADAYWTNAIEIPGLAMLNQTTAATGPMVCTSSANCVSGGAFTDGSSDEQAFISQETNGVWSSATEVAAALNVRRSGGHHRDLVSVGGELHRRRLLHRQYRSDSHVRPQPGEWNVGLSDRNPRLHHLDARRRERNDDPLVHVDHHLRGRWFLRRSHDGERPADHLQRNQWRMGGTGRSTRCGGI